MGNDEAWKIRSDEWIESMNASTLFKERRLQKKLVDSKLKEDAFIGTPTVGYPLQLGIARFVKNEL